MKARGPNEDRRVVGVERSMEEEDARVLQGVCVGDQRGVGCEVIKSLEGEKDNFVINTEFNWQAV